MQSHSTENLALYFMPNYFILIVSVFNTNRTRIVDSIHNVVPQQVSVSIFITVSESGGFVTKSAVTSAPQDYMGFPRKKHLIYMSQPSFCVVFLS